MRPFRCLIAPLLVLFPSAELPGHSTDEIVLAAMRLSEQSNYSWHTTVMDDARVYSTDGRTEANGYSWMRLPMVESLAWRFASTHPLNIEAYFRGNSECVVLANQGWMALRELPSRHEDWDDHYKVPKLPRRIGAPLNSYSNAQFALKRPHEELAIIVGSFATLEVQDDVATGTLSQVGAQLLLVADNQNELEPAEAAGRFCLWIEDGLVVKYNLMLEGVIYARGKPRLVHQISTTLIENVGRSSFEIPPEVRQQFDLVRDVKPKPPRGR